MAPAEPIGASELTTWSNDFFLGSIFTGLTVPEHKTGTYRLENKNKNFSQPVLVLIFSMSPSESRRCENGLPVAAGSRTLKSVDAGKTSDDTAERTQQENN